MRRFSTSVVSVLALVVASLALALPAQAGASARTVPDLTKVCVRDAGKTVSARSGHCGRRAHADVMRVSDRLPVCQVKRQPLRQIGAGACDRKGGRSLRLPENRTTWLCVAKSDNQVRAVRHRGGCTKHERLRRSGNHRPSGLSLSDATVPENVPTGTTVGTLSVVDPDPTDLASYSLESGAGDTDNAAFQVVGGSLQTAAPVDFETQSSYSVRVRATDLMGKTTSRAFTITVIDADENQAPTDLALSNDTVTENAPAGTTVGTLSTTDPDAGDTHTYTLVAGTAPNDNAWFVIEGDQLRTKAPLDFETQPTLSIRVRTDDGRGGSFEKDLTIQVQNANDAPTAIGLSPSSVPENSPGTTVGTLSATDQDAGDTATFALVSGPGSTDNSKFSISGSQLIATASLDYESQAQLQVRVRVTDSSGAGYEQVLQVTVLDRNDAPTGISLSPSSVPENGSVGDVVGTLSAADQDAGDTATFAFVTGTGDGDNASFTINGNQLKTAAAFDYEARSTYSVRVKVTDGAGATYETALTVTVTNVNETPTQVDLSNSSVDEEQPAGTVVGTLTTTDPDSGDTFSYTLVSGAGGTDNASFTIVGDELRTAAPLDYETQASYYVRVRSTDAAGEYVERQFTISLNPVNEAPTDLTLNDNLVDEEEPAGTTVGTLSGTDPDAGDTFTYSLVTGSGSDDNAAFVISGDELQTAQSFDYETKSSYLVRVRVTDLGGESFEKAFTINVVDVNEAATAITLTPSRIAENQPSYSTVGTLSANDPDAGATLTYTFVSGAGDGDNSAFDIVGDQLVLLAPADYETKSSYDVRVQVDDGLGGVYQQALTVTIDDVNDPPTDLGIDHSHVDENAAAGTTVGNLSATDQDLGETFTFAITSGGADFSLSGSALQTARSFDHEAEPTLPVTIEVTDSQGATYSKTLTITVDDVNEAPTNLALSQSSVAENQPSGTDVGTFVTSDPEATQTHTYSLVSGLGDTDNGSFMISGDTLKTGAVFDYETKDSYSIRVRSTDSGAPSGSIEQTFTITVTNGNDAPTAIALDPSAVDEHSPPGTTVGTLTATDSDPGDTFTWAFAPGGTDNGSFTIDGDQLKTSASFDYATKSSYSILVTVTDSGGMTYTHGLSVTVNNINDAPTDIGLSPSSVAENAGTNATVGTLSTTDPDPGDTFTYTLVTGTGSDDNGAFNISGSTLRASSSFDYETKDSYKIRVRSTDGGNLTFEKQLTVTVTNVNEAPTDLSLSSSSVDENAGNNATVGTLSTTDPDTADTFTYTLVTGTGSDDNGAFNISGSTLRASSSFDYETKNSYKIRVRSTDAGGLTVEKQLTITVNDVNEAPTAVGDSYTGVIGNTLAKKGTVSTTGPVVPLSGSLPLANDSDPDSGDSVHVVAVTDAGTTRGGSITIDADGNFTFQPAVGDKSVSDTYTYTVEDSHGLTATATITLTIGADRVWYIKSGATSTGANGDSAHPFPNLTKVNGTSGNVDGTGDTIFLYDGTYTNVLPLEASQSLVTERGGLTVNSISLVDGSGHTVTLDPGSSSPSLSLANNSSVTGLRIVASAGGPAVAASSVTLSRIDSTSTLEAVGTGSAGKILSITGSAGGNIEIAGSMIESGAVAAGTATAIDVQNRTSGLVLLSGQITISPTGNPGGKSGLNVANNTGSFAATHSGNTISTTTGTPVTITNSPIGSFGVDLDTVSSNGAPNGIVVNNTGTSGSLTVGQGAASCAANGGASCNGGQIANSTGKGISLTGTQAPSITGVQVNSSGDDGLYASALTGGLGVNQSRFNGNGNAVNENGLDLGDSSLGTPTAGSGTFSVSNSQILGSGDTGIFFGTLAASGTSFTASSVGVTGSASAAGSQDGIQVIAPNGSSFGARVTDSTFAGNLGDHVQMVAKSGGSLTQAKVDGNTMTGDTSGALGQGIVMAASGSPWTGALNYDVSGNTINGAVASAITVSATNVSGSTFEGYVRNNTIGTAGVPRSCSETAAGIHITNQGAQGTLVAKVDNNTIRRCYERGLWFDAGNASGGTSALQATVTNNTVADLTDDDSANGYTDYGAYFNLGLTSGDSNVGCLDLSANNIGSGKYGSPSAIYLRHRFGALALPGYTGGATDNAAVTTYLTGRNPLTSSANTAAGATQPGGSFTNTAGSAPCTQPSFS